MGAVSMNVFDFDKTLYDGDCTVDFYLFCLRRHPGLLRILPKQILGAIGFTLGRIPRDGFKERFYAFLPLIDDPVAEVEAFWQRNIRKMKPAVMRLAHEGDLVISASPAFLLAPPCEEHGWSLIASRVNPHTGRVQGANCRGSEKVARFKEAYPSQVIQAFYSDSLSDAPMASIAQKSYLVKGDEVAEWPSS